MLLLAIRERVTLPMSTGGRPKQIWTLHSKILKNSCMVKGTLVLDLSTLITFDLEFLQGALKLHQNNQVVSA